MITTVIPSSSVGRITILLCTGCSGTLISLKYLPIPYLVILFAWAIVWLMALISAKHTGTRILFLNLAVVAICLAALEAYAYSRWQDARPENEPTFAQDYKCLDDVLGKVPARGLASASKRMYGDAVLYDVVYTIESNGLRITPPVTGTPRGCVLVFGCSFTFGEGVNDDQSMPYRVGVLTEGKSQVFNFGFHGYGAHQMLAALQHGVVDRVVESQPTHVISQAIPDHVMRTTGLYAWGRHGPRYRLQPDGSVVQEGHFDDDDADSFFSTAFGSELRYQGRKSFLIRSLTGRAHRVTTDDVQLWVGIVDASRRLVNQKYPGAEFDVLLWKQAPLALYEQMSDALAKLDFTVHQIHNILPGYAEDPSPYEIPIDHHPNAIAHDAIARFVARELLGVPDPGPDIRP